jgi:rare lipoprotein A (peptidoglycan hydrolase)
MGCCLTLIVVPLLLLATPQRATLHGQRHRSGVVTGRARDGRGPASLSVSWATPVVYADLGTSGSVSSTPGTTASAAATGTASHAYAESVSFRQVLPTTTTTAPPPTTTAAPPPSPQPAPKPVAAPEVAAPKPVPVAAPSPVQSTTAGLASWYGSPAGTCASPSLAFGTVVTVTDLATGATDRCTVDDREAHNPGRVIDLSPATFSELASLAVGVIEVRLSW